MSSSETNSSSPSETHTLPDRMCTWCHIAMTKRLVGEGRFIHYICPQCIFQHTAKRS
ncbi:MAG: hypothetical protein O7F12_05765 [Nitrospirae bacterium]|nr:hypothetical protein [Nitrospirota bacterium]